MKYKGTIGVPVRDHMVTPFHFAQSLINVIRHCDSIWGPGAVKFETVNGSLLEENRQMLVNLTVGDWLLFLDDDMTFPHDIAERLDDWDKDIVTGLYWIGYPQHNQPAIYKKTDTDKPTAFFSDYPKDKLVEVGSCGMGACMIRRRVIDDFIGAGAFARYHKITGRVGEDMAFCYRARDKGYKIFCDTSLKCGHLRVYELTEEQGYINIGK